MAKAPRLEEKLAKLAALDLRAPGVLDQLRPALKDKSNLIVARAAHLAARAELRDLSDDLDAAFSRLLAASPAGDKGCFGKQAAAHALHQFGTGSEELFLAGIRHIQMEPAFGGPADTAAELRGTCALGLVRIGSRQALTLISDLLADPEQQCRIMAARALAYSGREEAALPLRVKILSGDKEISVTGECLAALIRLTPSAALPLLEKLLASHDDDLSTEAAMTLGSMRTRESFDLLRKQWQARMTTDARLTLLTPLALLRLPDAIDMLVEVIGSSPEQLAIAAIEAMTIYRNDAAVRNRVAAAASGRNSSVQVAAHKAMGDRS